MARLHSKQNKLLLTINETYRPFFDIHERRGTSRRYVAIIKPDEFNSFIDTLVADNGISAEIKALVCVLASSGIRISEALLLQRVSFEEKGAQIIIHSKVNKKRGKSVFRESIIHFSANDVVRDFVHRVGAFNRVFTLTRHSALKQLKDYFGEAMDLHSFRHSNLSYMLFGRGLSVIQVENIMKLSHNAVIRYTHLDTRPVLTTLFQQRSK